jgi:hypothetical protein
MTDKVVKLFGDRVTPETIGRELIADAPDIKAAIAITLDHEGNPDISLTRMSVMEATFMSWALQSWLLSGVGPDDVE